MGKVSKFERWWLDAWPHRLQIRQFVPRFIKDSPEPFRGEVLEVGAGSGWTSRRILDTFPQVELTATDVDTRSEVKFDKLRGRYGQRLKFQRADIMQLPFDRESYDIAVAIYVLHYVSDLHKAVKQLLRVLRPGGLIGIADDNFIYLPRVVRALFGISSQPSIQIIEKLLRSEGCEILKTNKRGYYYIWARKPYPIYQPPR